MFDRGITTGKLTVALGAAVLLLVPAIATAMPDSKRRPPAVSVSFDRMPGFTPANADPRLAAEFARRAPSAADFKFTPAAQKGRPSQLRVAIRAGSGNLGGGRLAEVESPAIGALAPTSYNLGVSVGWRRFAVTGDVSRATGNIALGDRESAVVGVNYSLNRRITGRVAATADRTQNERIPSLATGDGYSLDAGAAFKLTRNVAVTGGVRYRIDRDRSAPLQQGRSDSQAVYVGTAFKF